MLRVDFYNWSLIRFIECNDFCISKCFAILFLINSNNIFKKNFLKYLAYICVVTIIFALRCVLLMMCFVYDLY